MDEYTPKPPAPNGRYTPKKPKMGETRINGDGLYECFINSKWQIWNPELPDAGHPSEKRRETEPPTPEQLRRAYHDRVIRVGNNRSHVRMVGCAETLNNYMENEKYPTIRLWFPDSDFEKNEGKLD